MTEATEKGYELIQLPLENIVVLDILSKMSSDEFKDVHMRLLSPAEESGSSKYFIGSYSSFSFWSAFFSKADCYWHKNIFNSKEFPQNSKNILF